IADTQSSSDDCGELGFDHGVSIAGNGSASSGPVTVTVSGYNSPTGFVDWSSNAPIHGVYVKGGPSGGNLFSYPAGDTGDQDLHTPQKATGGYYEVSHVAVCWNDVPTEPDVTVEKANDPPGAVLQGGTITYTLTVSNEGDADATGVAVTDQLPAGVTFVSATAGCDVSAGTVTCALGDIGPGASLFVHVTVSVDEMTCGTIDNSALVSASNEGGAATGNSESNTVTNTVSCEREEDLPPDLQVTKTSDADAPLHPDDVVHYTITVTNVGDVAATGVELVDVLPVGATGVGTPLPSFGGGFCTITSSLPPGGVPHTEVRCGPISLAPGASASVTITTHVTDDTCGPITNMVDVEGSNEPAGNVGPDNHAEAVDEIACVPRIRVVKGGPERAHVGDSVTYVFTVTNTGGIALTDVELTDPKCDGAATLVDDGNGDALLAVGEVWHYTCDHTIVAADGDPVHNVATVTGDHEGGSVSDTDAHDVDVLHPAIQIEKTADPTSGTPGTAVVYTYVVTNTGDATLFDISVDDDVVGHVGDIASLAPGASAARSFEIVLGSSPITNVGTADGSDALGMSVSDDDDATVAVIAGAGGGSAGGSNGSISPFTGLAAGSLVAAIAALSSVGFLVLVVSRKRSGTT
ncbi:MAG TPA: DUF11 domain-containing protein, partial [Actinomycetota bacterium]|nr:DUF11 domain-containing protein [Actinomycetota bacterium]